LRAQDTIKNVDEVAGSINHGFTVVDLVKDPSSTVVDLVKDPSSTEVDLVKDPSSTEVDLVKVPSSTGSFTRSTTAASMLGG
jgi:hypothetical protein